MNPAENRGDAPDRAGVRLGVPLVQLRVAGGMSAEFHEQLRPSGLSSSVGCRRHDQFPQSVGTGRGRSDALVLRAAVADPALQ